jgi:hypothetical protein
MVMCIRANQVILSIETIDAVGAAGTQTLSVIVKDLYTTLSGLNMTGLQAHESTTYSLCWRGLPTDDGVISDAKSCNVYVYRRCQIVPRTVLSFYRSDNGVSTDGWSQQ